MSSGDFEARLRQSVNDHIALIQTSAAAAKARIRQGGPAASAPAVAPVRDADLDEAAPSARPVPAVNFFAEEPAEAGEPPIDDDAFASALRGPVDPLPEGTIAFDDFEAQNVDDEGIPVWEDPP